MMLGDDGKNFEQTGLQHWIDKGHKNIGYQYKEMMGTGEVGVKKQNVERTEKLVVRHIKRCLALFVQLRISST